MTKNFNYYKTDKRVISDHKQLITYSFNDKEQTITGIIEEREGSIFLYEYRGKYVGTEFFISFSKNSSSYKLIKINEIGEAKI